MSFDVMSQVKAAFTSLVSHSDDQDTVAKTGTGTLGGATVQMASTATPPARADGIGERLKAAFAPLADAFRDAKAWLQAKMHPPIDVQAPVHDKARSIARIGGRIEYTALNDPKSFNALDVPTAGVRGAITHAYGQTLMDQFVKSPTIRGRRATSCATATASRRSRPASRRNPRW